ncbi:MAG: HAMP domain-containing protein [Ideonella sp.]|nr:HAMP domain-containing protein [Ideonella sp.]
MDSECARPGLPIAGRLNSVRDWFKGRLFWKLLLALWVSMLLSIGAAIAYLRSTGQADMPPPDMASVGLLPMVPLVSGMLAMLVASVAVAWYLSGPLRHLRRGLNRVAQGDFDIRVAPLAHGRRDELTELAEDFDRMAGQLQQLTQARQILLHDISHELRSPLARMQAAIGLMRQDATLTPAMVDRIERESQRLDALIEELLTLHRLEAAPETWAVETEDVLDLLHAVAEDANFEARAASREVRIDAPGEFVASVRGELLHRAFENVIRNAVKHTAPGTVVDVQARPGEGGRGLVVSVADRGPGVPEDSLALIFEPFTRLEASAAARGVGLGLAIALRAIKLHGGSINAAPRVGGGLVVTMRLSGP